MRGGPDRWLSGRVWDDDPAPRRVQDDDHTGLSYHDGRAFRRETARHDPDNTVTQAEQKVLGERAREAAEGRLADMDRALLGAVRLGAALRELKGEDQ